MDINYKANISNEIENNVVINDQEIEIKDEQFKYDKGNTVEKEKKRKRKKALKLYFSSKHTVYLITLWLIFLLSFIIGFVVHFDTTKNVTASSILWTFSIVVCFFSVLYSYNYYKCKKAKSEEELQKYLKYFPC